MPGKKPCCSSSTPTAGLVITILEHSPDLNAFRAANTASIVLPVPAGPVAKTIKRCGFSNKSTYVSWFRLLGVNVIGFRCFWYVSKLVVLLLLTTVNCATSLRRRLLKTASWLNGVLVSKYTQIFKG